MPMMQNPTPLLTTAAVAGAAGLSRIQPVLAAEGALETTTIRPRRSRPSASLRGMSPTSFCAPRVSPISAMSICSRRQHLSKRWHAAGSILV